MTLIASRASRSATSGVLCLALALLMPASASAQQQASPTGRISGPFAGLFGGGQRAANHQSLDARASLFGAKQDVHVPSTIDPSLLDPRFQESATFGGAQSSVSYSFGRVSENSTVTSTASGSLSDFSTAPTSLQYGAFGGLSLSTRLTRRTSFNASGQAGYGSAYSLQSSGLGGGNSITGSIDPTDVRSTIGLPNLDLKNTVVFASAGLQTRLSSRSTVNVALQTQRTVFIGNAQSGLFQISSSAIYSHQLIRKLAVYAGYRREATLATIEGSPTFSNQSLDFGVNYGDGLTLQIARHTTLTMNVGLGSGKSLTRRTQFTALGSAALSQALGRSWSANLSYARTLGFVSGFQEPVLQDAVNASVGGQLGRRASLTSSAQYSRGYVGFDTARQFDIYGVTTALSIALHRRVSAFAQYAYYGNQVPAGLSSLPVFPSFARSAAVAGVQLWAPLYSKPRVRR